MDQSYGSRAFSEAPIRHTAAMTICNINRGTKQAMEIKRHDEQGWWKWQGVGFSSRAKLDAAIAEVLDSIEELGAQNLTEQS